MSKSKKRKDIATTALRTDQFTAELIVDPIDPLLMPPFLLQYDNPTGTSLARDSIDVTNTSTEKTKTYIPLPEEDPLLTLIKFPTQTEEYGTDQELHQNIMSFIHHWVQVEEFSEKISAYYVMFTWVFDLFHEVPYLRIRSDLSSGKSRLGLDVLGSIVYKAISTVSASSTASLFRAMDMVRGTVIIDEADLGDDSDKTSEIVQMINCGYTRSAKFMRTEPTAGGGHTIRIFDVFCPKIICSRANMKDNALESRCLPIKLEKLTRTDISLYVTDALEKEACALRNQLLLFRFRKLAAPKPVLNDSFLKLDIQPRIKQLMMLISSVIDNPEMIEELKNYALAMDKKQGDMISDSIHADILTAVCRSVSGKPVPKDRKFPFYFKELADAVMALRETNEFVDGRFIRYIGRACRESQLDFDLWHGERGNGVEVEESKLLQLCKKFGVDPPVFKASIDEIFQSI